MNFLGRLINKGLISNRNFTSSLFKYKISNFGAKSKDEGVDKSRKSVSGGGSTTTSDSDRREPGRTTIKVTPKAEKSTSQEPVSPAAQKPEVIKPVQPTQAEQAIKQVNTISGHKVRHPLNSSLLSQRIQFQVDTLTLYSSWHLKKKAYSKFIMTCTMSIIFMRTCPTSESSLITQDSMHPKSMHSTKTWESAENSVILQ